jgi:hypothetical protein
MITCNLREKVILSKLKEQRGIRTSDADVEIKPFQLLEMSARAG